MLLKTPYSTAGDGETPSPFHSPSTPSASRSRRLRRLASDPHSSLRLSCVRIYVKSSKVHKCWLRRPTSNRVEKLAVFRFAVPPQSARFVNPARPSQALEICRVNDSVRHALYTNSKLHKFKMADGRHIEIVFGHNSAADCSISVKFCVGKEFFAEFRQWEWYSRSTEVTKRISCFHNAVWVCERRLFVSSPIH